MNILDWRALAPAREIHDCECRYCDAQGEQEPTEWPTLITCDLDGVAYVSDRFMAIRADLAPIPEDYEGPVIKGPAIPKAWTEKAPLQRQARGVHFRWQVVQATDLTGWQLRYVDDPKFKEGMPRMFAVFAEDNETHIGWAMSSRERDLDYWSGDFTREYGDTEDES